MLTCASCERVVAGEFEDLGKDGFPVGGRATRELIDASLQDKRRVDEGLVANADELIDSGLCLPDRSRLGQGAVSVAVENLEFQRTGTRPRGLPKGATDAETAAIKVEDEGDI